MDIITNGKLIKANGEISTADKQHSAEQSHEERRPHLVVVQTVIKSKERIKEDALHATQTHFRFCF